MPPEQQTSAQDLASVVAAKVEEAIQAANQRTKEELSQAKKDIADKAQADLQAAIAKEQSETAKEHEQVEHLNQELSNMQARLKVLERSASMSSIEGSPDKPAKKQLKRVNTLPESVFSSPEPKPESSRLRQHSSSGGEDNTLCVVCWENSKNALLIPCKHLCTCYECATSTNSKGVRLLQECPMCRTNIFNIEKIFVS